MIKNGKKCCKCKQYKGSIEFHIDNSKEDALSEHCKKCVMDKSLSNRGIEDELNPAEKSLLLKYYPYAHDTTQFICKNPQALGVDKSIPFTLSEVARDNGLTHGEAQRLFYKFTRMRLTTLVIKGDDEGKIISNIVYKMDNIREII